MITIVNMYDYFSVYIRHLLSCHVVFHLDLEEMVKKRARWIYWSKKMFWLQ